MHTHTHTENYDTHKKKTHPFDYTYKESARCAFVADGYRSAHMNGCCSASSAVMRCAGLMHNKRDIRSYALAG